MTTIPLRLRSVGITYGHRRILDDFDLDVGPGEAVALMGQSGSGKTSILSAALGQVRHTGEIAVCGTVVSPKTARTVRRDLVGVVFQHAELLVELSPLENIALGGMICGQRRADAEASARTWMTNLAIPDAAASDTLSGGERQRAALARALIKKPAIVLADEPTGSLDETTRDHAARVLFQTVRDNESALLVVTHDPAVAALADRTVHLATLGPEIGT